MRIQGFTVTGLTVRKGFHMTDLAQGDVQSSSTTSPTPVDTSSASAPQQSSAPTSERTFKQSEVNDLIGRAKYEAVERHKRDSSISAHQQPAHVPQGSYQPQNSNQSYLTPDEVKRLAAEETQRLRNEWIQEAQQNQHQQEAQRIAGEFFSKIDAGKSKYEDFDSVMSEVNLGNIANTVALANSFENTADIMYELSKNPAKIGNIEHLMTIDPKLAMAEMRRLSTAIKNNAEASNFRSPNEPLSQLRPTSAGAEKSGPLTAADYRRRYRV